MANIRVTPEELEQQGNALVEIGEELEQILTSVDNKIAEICDAWDGLAQDAFLSSYEGMKETLKSFPEIVDGLGQQTIAAAQTFGEVDSQLSSSFSG